jgi:hypothetical protein
MVVVCAFKYRIIYTLAITLSSMELLPDWQGFAVRNSYIDAIDIFFI